MIMPLPAEAASENRQPSSRDRLPKSFSDTAKSIDI